MDERRAHTRKSAVRRFEIELLHETPLIRYAGLSEACLKKRTRQKPLSP
jgi:hypothetical protein